MSGHQGRNAKGGLVTDGFSKDDGFMPADNDASHAALRLAQDLIRCRSVTPEDRGALDVVADALRNAGFAIERPVFSEAGYPDTPNLFARIGQGGPCLVFAGHTDVVPPGDPAAWRQARFAAIASAGPRRGVATTGSWASCGWRCRC